MRLTRHEQSAPALGGTPEQTPGGYFWRWRAVCKCLSQVDKVKNEVSLTGPEWCNYDWKARRVSPQMLKCLSPWHGNSFHFQIGKWLLNLLTYGPVRSILLPKCALSPREPVWIEWCIALIFVCVYTHRNIIFIY